MEKEIKSKKKNSGITLIALVITIIVLIILAGVSIIILTTDNNIINKTKEAKLNNDMAKVKEFVELMLQEYRIESFQNNNKEKLIDFLNNKNEKSFLDIEENENKKLIDIYTDKYDIEIDVLNLKVNKIELIQNFVMPEVTVGFYNISNNKEELEKGKKANEINLTVFVNNLDMMDEKKVKSIKLYNSSNESIDKKLFGIGQESFEVDLNGNYIVEVKGKINGKIRTTKLNVTINQTNNKIITNYKVGGYIWEKLYDDAGDIYLITTSTILKKDIPNGRKGTIIDENESANNLYTLDNIANDYSGSDDIAEEKIKKLNSSYFDRNGNGVYDDGYKSTAQNMREVAYLLDTSIWTLIFANEYVDYAIGGPTIEMIVKVLNNLEENENIQYAAKAVNEDGYRVSKDNGKTWIEELSLVNLRPITNSRLGEFEKFSKGDYWVASPSASYWSYYDFGRPVWCICKFWGNDKYRLYHSAKNPYSVNSSGFRPVVCLKKEFKLQESSDGVGYEIVRK